MANLRPVPLSQNQHSSWQNLIQKTVQGQNVVAGSGLRAGMSTGDFTELTAETDVDMDRLHWAGDFDEFAEYQLNDVVRVNPNVAYVDVTTGLPLEIGSTSDLGFDYAPLSLGLFVCVHHVPPAWSDEDYFSSTIFPTYPTAVPYTWQDGVRWNTYNYYYPMYPEVPTKYTSSVDTGFGFTVIANQTFWQAMPIGMRAMTGCTNGVTTTTYIMGVVSGSAFQLDYLPYA